MENIVVENLEKSKNNFSKPESISNLRYEIALNELFKRLNIRSNQCQLIRAFFIASKGKKHFEVSYLDLVNILFPKDSASIKTLKKRIENRLKVLLDWQEINGIELIRILERGHQTQTESGRFDYYKTQYEFVMLDEITNLLHSPSEEDLDDRVEMLIASLTKQYQPTEQKKKYHPRHQIKKNKQDIVTKFRKNFELLVSIDENPVDYSQSVLNDVCEMLNEMEQKWTEQRARENLMSDFESQIYETEKITDEGDLGLKF